MRENKHEDKSKNASYHGTMIGTLSHKDQIHLNEGSTKQVKYDENF